MGRKKIKIQPIKEDRNRSVTYLKRKAGLFKKAHELAVLTDSQVAVIVFGHNGKLAEFCSTDIDLLLLRYTEYDGVAERKGPQHYLGLDKDSDDENENDDDGDADDAHSGDAPPDPGQDGEDPGGSGGGGGRGGDRDDSNGPAARRMSGIKRKAEPPSPKQSFRANGSVNGARQQHASSIGSALQSKAEEGPSPNTKQALNAALRQKGQHKVIANGAANASGDAMTNPAYNMLFADPSALSQPTPNTGIPMFAAGPSLSVPPSHPTSSFLPQNPLPQIALSPMVNPGRAAAIANMTISMPAANDRVPIYVLPATPGITPGGTVTTPGGRRSSFSDVFLRGESSVSIARPISASSLVAPTFMQTQNGQMGFSGSTGFAGDLSPSVTPQPPSAAQNTSLSGTDSLQPSMAAGLDGASLFEPRQTAQFMSRPASTGFQRTLQGSYNQINYAIPPTPVAPAANGSNPTASPIRIVRPYTASGDFANAENAHLAPPAAAFGGSGMSPQSMQHSSVSPTPSMFGSGSFATGSAVTGTDGLSGMGRNVEVTPVDSSSSSATPDFVSAPDKRRKIGPGQSISTSGSNPSTDDDSPMSSSNNNNNNNNAASGFMDGMNGLSTSFSQWFNDEMSTQKGDSNHLVQPVPIHPNQQSFSGIGFPGLSEPGFVLGGSSGP